MKTRKVHIHEKPWEALVTVHVAHRVQVDDCAHPGHDEHHRHAEGINAELPQDFNPCRRDRDPFREQRQIDDHRLVAGIDLGDPHQHSDQEGGGTRPDRDDANAALTEPLAREQVDQQSCQRGKYNQRYKIKEVFHGRPFGSMHYPTPCQTLKYRSA